MLSPAFSGFLRATFSKLSPFFFWVVFFLSNIQYITYLGPSNNSYRSATPGGRRGLQACGLWVRSVFFVRTTVPMLNINEKTASDLADTADRADATDITVFCYIFFLSGVEVVDMRTISMRHLSFFQTIFDVFCNSSRQ